jgi:hypothetical protein
MIEHLLAIQTWDSAVNGKFIRALDDYFNEDKCELTVQAAYELMKRGNHRNLVSAETILIYATQHYFDVKDTNYKALVYYCLGQLYEFYKEDFVKSYTYYDKYVLNNTKYDGTHALMLRATMHRDNFTYSEEMEKHLKNSMGEVDLGLRNDRLYENLGCLIVAQHNSDEEKVAMYTKRLKNIVKSDEWLILDLVFRKDTVPDSLKVPKKVINFIKEL